MFDKCPFFPNDIFSCKMRQCKFLCNGGCAILLSAYASDAYEETKEITKKLADTEYKLGEIDRKISHFIK